MVVMDLVRKNITLQNWNKKMPGTNYSILSKTPHNIIKTI